MGRELQNAQTPEGLREAWAVAQSAWQETVADTPRALVDSHVEDEWSLAQTLRRLILASDGWLRRGIQQMEQPFHEIGQIFTGAEDMGFDTSVFRVDPPAYDEIFAVRAERQQQVTDFLGGIGGAGGEVGPPIRGGYPAVGKRLGRIHSISRLRRRDAYRDLLHELHRVAECPVPAGCQGHTFADRWPAAEPY